MYFLVRYICFEYLFGIFYFVKKICVYNLEIEEGVLYVVFFYDIGYYLFLYIFEGFCLRYEENMFWVIEYGSVGDVIKENYLI